jgi:hypothetical protein
LIKGFLTRTYQLDDIVIWTRKRAMSSYFIKLYASKQKSTGEKKAVFRVTLTLNNHSNLYIIPYYEFTFYHIHTAITKEQKQLDMAMLLPIIGDQQIQSALFIKT